MFGELKEQMAATFDGWNFIRHLSEKTGCGVKFHRNPKRSNALVLPRGEYVRFPYPNL